MYYSRKLLSVAHNRIDRYISLKYQGLKCLGIGFEQIAILDKDEQTYLVDSQTERNVKYLVDMSVGICTCMGGQDGSPCSHQAAVVKFYGVPSVNCIPTLSSQTRQEIAVIAIGSKAIEDSHFYASIHQEKLDSLTNDQSSSFAEEFTGPSWDLIRSSAIETPSISEDEHNDLVQSDCCDLVTKITEFSADIITRVKETSAIIIVQSNGNISEKI